MVNANFFTESQAQFSESQKKLVQLWDESQRQLIESQKKLVESWTSSLPSGIAQPDLTENFEKALSFQQDVVNSAISAQQTAVRLTMETQKQFWDSYFQSTRQMMQGIQS